MKYLAILKDSLREALDTKVIYFTVGLSVLVILFIGSVTYRPISMEENLRFLFKVFNWDMELKTQGLGPRYEIEDFSQTNEAAEPWKGDYRFTLSLVFENAVVIQEIQKQKLNSTGALQGQLGLLFEEVQVREVAGKPTELRFQVQTKGTRVTERQHWPHEARLFFGALPLSFLPLPLSALLLFITDWIIATFGVALTMLLSTVVTAFFIPNMLHKGTVDLLLARPIHRTTLLAYKFLGGLTFMLVNTAIVLAGLWFVLGLQSGIWINGLWLCILIFTFQFAIFYAISTLMAVLTRSPIVAILVAVVAWGFLFGVGWSYRYLDARRPEKLGPIP